MARTVLIVKLAAVGDVVMALPMVTALRAEDPDIRITWMCGQKAAPLVRLVEGVSEVVSVNEAAMLAGSFFAQVVAVMSAWRHVRVRRFDAVYIATFGRSLPRARMADHAPISGAGLGVTRQPAGSCPAAPTPTSTCDS